MKISVVTLFPDLYKPFFSTSLVDRARKSGAIDPEVYSLFDYAAPGNGNLKERIDGPTFGHGAGMVIKPDVIERAVVDGEAKRGKAFKIFFSPRGKKLDQTLLQALYNRIQSTEHLMLLPARYEGMDARIEQEYADEIISIGDFVLMGGDLPAMVFLEGLLRFVPGIVGKSESVEQDSFSGPFVDYPEYTAPVVWKGHQVPEILRSGNHKAIADWRLASVVKETVIKHFEWLRTYTTLSEVQEKEVRKALPPHYVVLMHSQVLVNQAIPGESGTVAQIGTTSVTSLDIHDIARAATTYGLKNYFLVTPLADQQAIVNTLLGFWKHGPGVSYNNHRHQAVKHVIVESNLENVIEYITRVEGKAPLLVATGANKDTHPGTITFNDQEKVWSHERPVVLILGTGQGLAPELIQRCDYRLVALEGFADFNHLSVRSAAAVIFDRWLGKNPASEALRKVKKENDSVKIF